jgi:hypothetical protein
MSEDRDRWICFDDSEDAIKRYAESMRIKIDDHRQGGGSLEEKRRPDVPFGKACS